MSCICIKLFVLIMAFNLFGCAKPIQAPGIQAEAVKGKELYCLAETLAEAEEIASLYDITLVSFGDGVATFTTDRDLQEVIEYGKKNDLPPISINTSTIKPYSKKDTN